MELCEIMGSRTEAKIEERLLKKLQKRFELMTKKNESGKRASHTTVNPIASVMMTPVVKNVSWESHDHAGKLPQPCPPPPPPLVLASVSPF